MARLIDANRVIVEACKERAHYQLQDNMPHADWIVGGIKKVIRIIEESPTIDPVIHCRDCVHWETYLSNCPMMHEEWFDDEDDGLDIVTHDNTPKDGSGFCHMAKKKEDENETD